MNELKGKGHSRWGIRVIPVSLLVALAILFTGCASESTNLNNLQVSISKETAERKKDVKELKTLISQGLAEINTKEVSVSHETKITGTETSADTHAAIAVTTKPSPEEIMDILSKGNARFVAGTSTYPNTGSARLALAATENQANYAYATVLSCSDSRVPPELIFDAGIMDLFIVRVAGNVADTDEIGSIEYGLAHVKTPVLVVMGHTQCGAVTAVTQAINGEGHALEINIPPLVDNIQPAVNRAIELHPDVHENDIIPYAIEENVWQSIEDLFMKSPATREMVKNGTVKVVGAIYDLSTGKVEWLSESVVAQILAKVEANPDRQTQAMANTNH